MEQQDVIRLCEALDKNTSAMCAVVEALGAIADNQVRLSRGEAMAYAGDAITDAIARHGLQGF